MGHCMCLCVCVCFRGTDLFPHREDSPCLIREERLRARQGDGQMRGGKKKKKKKRCGERNTGSSSGGLDENVFRGPSSSITTMSRNGHGEFEVFRFTHKKTCDMHNSHFPPWGICHNPDLTVV